MTTNQFPTEFDKSCRRMMLDELSVISALAAILLYLICNLQSQQLSKLRSSPKKFPPDPYPTCIAPESSTAASCGPGSSRVIQPHSESRRFSTSDSWRTAATAMTQGSLAASPWGILAAAWGSSSTRRESSRSHPSKLDTRAYSNCDGFTTCQFCNMKWLQRSKGCTGTRILRSKGPWVLVTDATLRSGDPLWVLSCFLKPSAVSSMPTSLANGPMGQAPRLALAFKRASFASSQRCWCCPHCRSPVQWSILKRTEVWSFWRQYLLLQIYIILWIVFCIQYIYIYVSKWPRRNQSRLVPAVRQWGSEPLHGPGQHLPCHSKDWFFAPFNRHLYCSPWSPCGYLVSLWHCVFFLKPFKTDMASLFTVQSDSHLRRMRAGIVPSPTRQCHASAHGPIIPAQALSPKSLIHNISHIY